MAHALAALVLLATIRTDFFLLERPSLSLASGCCILLADDLIPATLVLHVRGASCRKADRDGSAGTHCSGEEVAAGVNRTSHACRLGSPSLSFAESPTLEYEEECVEWCVVSDAISELGCHEAGCSLTVVTDSPGPERRWHGSIMQYIGPPEACTALCQKLT